MSYEKSIPDMLLTAGYLAMGAAAQISKTPVDFNQCGGEIGFYANLCALAEVSEDTLVALEVEDFPGVLDYEVSEPFGRWYAENWPEYDDACDELRKRITEWVNRS